MEQKINNNIIVCIPTNRDNPENSFLDSTLSGIANQSVLPYKIILRDEGKFECFAKHSTRMLWNLLSMLGIELIYMRNLNAKGVANARFELSEIVPPNIFTLMVDDDVVLKFDAIETIINAARKIKDFGFIQGQKIEINPNRNYLNDINKLNCLSSKIDPVRIFFGDAAFLLVKSNYLKEINWEIVTKYSYERLAGEDVLITLQIADKYPCYGIPDAVGWHISPFSERWRWEISSDLLQVELLKNIVSSNTLSKALPHIKVTQSER